MTPEQDESAVPERVHLSIIRSGDLTQWTALGWSSNNAEGEEHAWFIRLSSVIDRLKKKRDEWERSAEDAQAGTLDKLQMIKARAADELIAEFEKE